MMIENHLPGVIEQESKAGHGEITKGVIVLADGPRHHPEKIFMS